MPAVKATARVFPVYLMNFELRETKQNPLGCK